MTDKETSFKCLALSKVFWRSGLNVNNVRWVFDGINSTVWVVLTVKLLGCRYYSRIDIGIWISRQNPTVKLTFPSIDVPSLMHNIVHFSCSLGVPRINIPSHFWVHCAVIPALDRKWNWCFLTPSTTSAQSLWRALQSPQHQQRRNSNFFN